MKVEVETAGYYCKPNCPNIEPDIITFYANGRGVNVLACKYKNICENAVELYKESLKIHSLD